MMTVAKLRQFKYRQPELANLFVSKHIFTWLQTDRRNILKVLVFGPFFGTSAKDI